MELVKAHERENLTGEGGVNCEVKEGEGFFKLISAFIKKVTKKMLAGQFNFGTMQRPTTLSNPVSHVQLMANELAVVVDKCKLMIGTTDPLDRLKLLTAGIVGNLSYNVLRSGGKGPVNPVLGETNVVSSAVGDA